MTAGESRRVTTLRWRVWSGGSAVASTPFMAGFGIRRLDRTRKPRRAVVDLMVEEPSAGRWNTAVGLATTSWIRSMRVHQIRAGARELVHRVQVLPELRVRLGADLHDLSDRTTDRPPHAPNSHPPRAQREDRISYNLLKFCGSSSAAVWRPHRGASLAGLRLGRPRLDLRFEALDQGVEAELEDLVVGPFVTCAVDCTAAAAGPPAPATSTSTSIWPTMKVNRAANASDASVGVNPALARIDITPSANRVPSADSRRSNDNTWEFGEACSSHLARAV